MLNRAEVKFYCLGFEYQKGGSCGQLEFMLLSMVFNGGSCSLWENSIGASIEAS